MFWPLTLTAALLVAVFALRGVLSRQMLYPAPAFPVPTPPPAGLMEVQLSLPGGGGAHAWARLEEGAKVAVVILHGNGENLGTLAYSGILEKFLDLRVSFLVVDYPGYGRSPGNPSERANVAAALAGLDWLEHRQPSARKVLWGWSLGAAVALQTALQAARQRPGELAGLAIFSPWSSLEAVAREHFPGWLVRTFLVESYDSVAAAGEVRVPALVIHGREDEIIPPRQGAAVAARLGGPHRWVEVPGVGHNDLLAEPRVWEELGNFLAGL